jgi:hypothetical protein
MTSRGTRHFEASKRGDTGTGLIKLESGKDVCGVVRRSVGLPDYILVARSADSSGTKLLGHLIEW